MGNLEHAVWHALQTKHRHLSLTNGGACRYQPDVAPFAAVEHPGAAPLQQLRSLMNTGEPVWLSGSGYPSSQGLLFGETLPCLQMILPENVLFPAENDDEIQPLTCADAGEMVALTELAFPGFFRLRTCEMGRYYGMRSPSGSLIAMSGERLQWESSCEISGVCTHPAFRGHGFASKLMRRVVQDHQAEGTRSWLHVKSSNHHARDLYLRMGFKIIQEVGLTHVTAT